MRINASKLPNVYFSESSLFKELQAFKIKKSASLPVPSVGNTVSITGFLTGRLKARSFLNRKDNNIISGFGKEAIASYSVYSWWVCSCAAERLPSWRSPDLIQDLIRGLSRLSTRRRIKDEAEIAANSSKGLQNKAIWPCRSLLVIRCAETRGWPGQSPDQVP